MIKKLIPVLIIIAIVASVFSCASESVSDLKFYVISRDSLKRDMSDSETVKTVKDQGRLAFDGNDIEGYHWQSHTVKLYAESVPSLGYVTPESGGSKVFKVDDTYAFVLLIGNKLIYAGGFEQGVKNVNTPLQPSIRDKDDNSFSITFDSKYSDFSDNRSDEYLYSFLNKHGLLSAK